VNDTGSKILEALFSIFDGEEKKAQANLTNYLNNAAGIGEHPDVLAAIQDQLDIIAHEEERIEVLQKYFVS
jgi:xanthine dehydrogenase iron-sulfur cluster and FAD-binding subunit A